MRNSPQLVLVLATLSLSLSGCLVRTAANVVTAPVRVASKAVDVATTSQSEADENRGREIRRREERLAQLERRMSKERSACNAGDRDACEDAEATREELLRLMPQVPYEPR